MKDLLLKRLRKLNTGEIKRNEANSNIGEDIEWENYLKGNNFFLIETAITERTLTNKQIKCFEPF